MLFATCPPPAPLGDAISELWLMEDDGKSSVGLPKPYVELVVSIAGVHWWRAAPGAKEIRYERGWVTPIQDGPRYARAAGRRRLIGARIEPWAATIAFGRSRIGGGAAPVPLTHLGPLGLSRIRKQLRAANSEEQCFDLFGAWLLATLPIDRLIGPRAIASASDRTRRRHFARDLGVAPKRWSSLQRLERVLRDPALSSRALPLSAVAAEHGFADQAHFNREVVRWTGTTPGRLRRREGNGPPHLVRID